LILPAHFVPARSREEAKALFAASVSLVELEVFTYCNRTCWFCPNAQIDRRSTNHYMDETLYLRILGELAETDYRGVVTYSRYNEPLADRIILTRLRQARGALPNAFLSTHSNGDYLTRAYLNELREAGLNRIFIMSYLGNNDRFDEVRILERMTTKAAELGLSYTPTIAESGERHQFALEYEGMEVYIEGRNYEAVGTDRGKLVTLPPYVRTSWCPVVFQDLYVDWNGSVVPCCNIRSDAPEHQSYVIDNISGGRSIFEAWASAAHAGWRRSLFNFEPKQAPCDSCRYQLVKDDEKNRNILNIIRHSCLDRIQEP
jgi:radical SAM protein with 4Fe4S-binding SPASM domain